MHSFCHWVAHAIQFVGWLKHVKFFSFFQHVACLVAHPLNAELETDEQNAILGTCLTVAFPQRFAPQDVR